MNVVLDALQNHHKKLIEVGVGSEKTLNCLKGAAAFSLRQNKKVVFSTGAWTTQDQSFKKDILKLNHIASPAVVEALTKAERKSELKIVLIKERNNYISIKRFGLFQEKQKYMDHEVTFLIKITIWLQKTTTGDMNELCLLGKEFSLRDEVCCNEYACLHEDMEFQNGTTSEIANERSLGSRGFPRRSERRERGPRLGGVMGENPGFPPENGCFFLKVHSKANAADLIIVSHSMMIKDAAGGNCLLPEYSYMIIDEADDLEKTTRESLATAFSLNILQKPFEKLKNVLTYGDEDKKSDTIEKIGLFLIKSEIFFGLVGIFLEKESSKNPANQGFIQCNLLTSDTQSKEYAQARNAGELLIETGMEILDKLSSYKQNDSRQQIKGYLHEAKKQLIELKTILMRTEQTNFNEIILIFKNHEQNIFIKRSPIHIDQTLNELLFTKKESIILIADALRTDHSFHYIRKELGLGTEFEEMAFPPHFLNPEQIQILIPENLPAPMANDYFITCEKLIYNIIQANGGRVLVLFTSKKTLSSMYHRIAPELKAIGFSILAQGITGGRGKILEHFKDEPQSCAIFATNNFWENATFLKKELNCVIIHKIAFDFPDDPLILASSKDYYDSFKDYYLPRAILRFKKTFNQFIASTVTHKKDSLNSVKNKATMVILDSRITQKNYGKDFLESLPEEIRVIYEAKENLHKLL